MNSTHQLFKMVQPDQLELFITISSVIFLLLMGCALAMALSNVIRVWVLECCGRKAEKKFVRPRLFSQQLTLLFNSRQAVLELLTSRPSPPVVYFWLKIVLVHNLLVELTYSWSGPSGTTWEPWPALTWPSCPSGIPWMTVLRKVYEI